MESAVKVPRQWAGQIVSAKVGRDSQGSLPKSAAYDYLDDNTTEL
jgi:hypothetical protein